ncbi:hypothetical protein RJ640_006235 [Escallonia rubra]|uniref:TIR domain-containing protein n=1 Tax=Escallonia rubra TaxID=112253 RepID=A0AA88QPX2_9ASTE|nr:hypothetical protein RJ640_006235 [Escallonia rubra]
MWTSQLYGVESLRSICPSPIPKLCAMATTSGSPFAYHVFLSFRGEDTGKTFTDHLYTALVQAKFQTFRVNDSIERGKYLNLELPEAIKPSRISIVVLSKNYASSTWCLDELVTILECNKMRGNTVLPVFYDVEPTEVRKQMGSFAEAFLRHDNEVEAEGDRERRMELAKRVEGWKAALRQVAVLAGMALKNQADGHELKFIQKILKVVGDEVKRTVLNVPPHLIGLDLRARNINSWLQDGSNNVAIVAIWGMVGIGKTTIAKYLYYLNSESFEGSSFLASIREVSEQPKGLLRLQKQLLSDILRGRNEKIFSVDQGIGKIKEALCYRKVLVVLDDVDQVDQLDALLGMRDCLHQGSKIIITTRKKQLLKASEVHMVHEVSRMDNNQSLELFSWYATVIASNRRRDFLPKEYWVQSWEEDEFTNEDGEHLEEETLMQDENEFPTSEAKEIEETKAEQEFKAFKAIENDKLTNGEEPVEKIEESENTDGDDNAQYEEMEDESIDKDVRVHGGQNVNNSGMTFDVSLREENVVGSFPLYSLSNFEEESNDYFFLAKNDVIVPQEYAAKVDVLKTYFIENHPRELFFMTRKDNDFVKSRTSYYPQLGVENLLSDTGKTKAEWGSALEKLEAIPEGQILNKLKISYDSLQDDHDRNLFLDIACFFVGKDKDWTSTILDGCEFFTTIGIHNLIDRFLLRVGPGDNKLMMHQLIQDMGREIVKQESTREPGKRSRLWHTEAFNVLGEKTPLKLLKMVDLSHSHGLVSGILDFSLVPNLEKLVLKYCINLVEVHESIRVLQRLILLDLKGCRNLRKLPTGIHQLKSLEKLILSGCSKLHDESPAYHLDNMEPPTLAQVKSWAAIKIRKNPEPFGFSFASLPSSLVTLNLANCHLSDGSLPKDFGSLGSLQTLNLSGNPMRGVTVPVLGLVIFWSLVPNLRIFSFFFFSLFFLFSTLFVLISSLSSVILSLYALFISFSLALCSNVLLFKLTFEEDDLRPETFPAMTPLYVGFPNTGLFGSASERTARLLDDGGIDIHGTIGIGAINTVSSVGEKPNWESLSEWHWRASRQ